MTEVKYTLNTSASVSFYKQDKEAKIQIVMRPEGLKKVFGGTGSGVSTVIYLSGIKKGTFYYNNVEDLTGDYVYIVTSNTNEDKKVFFTINAKKEKTVDGTVKKYYWKFVASEAFGKDERGREDDVEALKKEFTNSDVWMNILSEEDEETTT